MPIHTDYGKECNDEHDVVDIGKPRKIDRKKISFHPDCVFVNTDNLVPHYWAEPGAMDDWRVVCEHGTAAGGMQRLEAELFSIKMNVAYTHGVWNRS